MDREWYQKFMPKVGVAADRRPCTGQKSQWLLRGG